MLFWLKYLSLLRHYFMIWLGFWVFFSCWSFEFFCNCIITIIHHTFFHVSVCTLHPNAYFYSTAGYKNSGLTERLNHVEETGRPISFLLPYTFKCLFAFTTGSVGSWWVAVQINLGFVIFLPFVTAHLKSQEPEAQDRWNLLKKESVSNLTPIFPNVK